MSFVLINPNIKSVTIKSKMKSSDNAAQDLWKKFSNNIKNYTPEFYFSFYESGSNNIYHYQVNESLENNKVKYSLEKYKNKNINNKKFIKDILNKQNGGKDKSFRDKPFKHKSRKDSSSSASDDNSSSSSSSGDDLMHTYYHKSKYNLPLSVSYNPNVYSVNNILLPQLASRYSYSIDTDGLQTIYAPNSNGVGVYKYKDQKWQFEKTIKP
jgi:hypothetical protein